MDVNSVPGSAPMFGFLVLVTFCKKEKGYPLEQEQMTDVFFSLQRNRGFRNGTFSAFANTLKQYRVFTD